MTAVAGITDGTTVWMGADSAGVTGTSLQVRADAKVFTTGPYLIAFTTSFRMGQILRYGFFPPPPEGDLHAHMCTTFTDALRDALKDAGYATRHNEAEAGGNFLVGVAGRLFEVQSDYQVGERDDPFTATGCGEDLLLGSLHTSASLGWDPEKRLLHALEAAERYSTGVRGPFRFARTPEVL